MDVKNVMKGLGALPLRPKDKIERSIKAETTKDRDANGQTPSGGQQGQDQGPMSDEQMQKCIEHLKSLSFVKDHQLVVELTETNSKKFVLIKEPSGKIVRRISEAELWSLQVADSKDKGQLLRKTA